jgi:hypothetical protein
MADFDDEHDEFFVLDLAEDAIVARRGSAIVLMRRAMTEAPGIL